MDAGPGKDADRPAVPRLLHRGGHMATAAALWLVLAAAGAARDRARRRRGGVVETRGVAAGKSTAANSGWVVFEDEAGQSMTPPRARTWGRRGSIPIVRVRWRGSGRVSMAGVTCYKPEERSRIFYATREYGAARMNRRASAGRTTATWSSAPIHSSAARSCWCGTTCACTWSRR